MKKIFIYGLLAGTAFLSSCSEDFLVKEPPLYVIEADVFSNPELLAQNVNSLYAGLKSQYTLGGKAWLASDNMGEDFINVAENGYELTFCYNANVTLDRQENYELWRYTYLAINRCNVFLQNIENAKEVAGSNYAKYVAEAKFIRALAYYYLHQFYTTPYVLNPSAKSVPLRLQAELSLENNDLARSSSQQVLDQILSDLSDSSALPDGDGTTATVTHASKAAVEMLKQRVYLVKGDWDNAIAAGEKVKGYALAADIASVFQPPYITSENIFSFPFELTNAPGGQYAVGYYYQIGRSDIIDVATGIVSKKGYGEAADARIAKLTVQNAAKDKTFLTKFPSNPYIDWLPIFRYAETLLNMAEAYANKGDDAKALELLKQVRSRSLPAADDPLSLDGLKGDALKTAIYDERRLEFLGEGQRAMDYLRRGETIVKQKGTSYELTISPSLGTNGYIWPIPAYERAQNKAIED